MHALKPFKHECMWKSFAAFLVPLILVSAAHATKLVVTHDACHAAVHKPDADVAYEPGIAADGSAVAPADLPNDHTIKIDPKNLPPAVLTVDLARRLHLPANFQSEMKIPVATLTYTNDQWQLNGQPIQPDEDAIAVLCNSKH